MTDLQTISSRNLAVRLQVVVGGHYQVIRSETNVAMMTRSGCAWRFHKAVPT